MGWGAAAGGVAQAAALAAAAEGCKAAGGRGQRRRPRGAPVCARHGSTAAPDTAAAEAAAAGAAAGSRTAAASANANASYAAAPARRQPISGQRCIPYGRCCSTDLATPKVQHRGCCSAGATPDPCRDGCGAR